MSLILLNPQIIDYTADLIIKANLEDEWDEFIADGQRSEDIFKHQMRIWFRQQSDSAVNALHGKKSILKYRSEDMIDFQRYQILFEEFEQMVFFGSEMYIEITGKDIPADIKKYIPTVGIIEKWGQKELVRLGLGISFDVLNPRVIDFVRTYAFRFSWEINAETNSKLQALLINAFEQGHSIDKTEKNIREMFDWMTKNRSRMIARTEVKRAQNFGAEESYIESGVVEAKVWFTARDERVCFAENTQIETENGLKSINKIKTGDVVNTHNGYCRVINIVKTKKTGRMIKITFNNNQGLICTPDHPIYEINKGWQYAKELNIGDKLQTSKNEIIEIANLNYLKFFKAYNYISRFFKCSIFSNIFNLIVVPICTVNLKANAKGGKKKVNFITTNRKFLDKFNFQSFKRLPYCFLKRGFIISRIRTIARERAKSSFLFFSRHDSKFFSTIKASIINRRSTTFFRAVAGIMFGIKRLSTSLTYTDLLKTMSTLETTNGISVSGSFGNRKDFITDRTKFINHDWTPKSTITNIRTKSSATFNLALSLIRRFSAIFANYHNAFCSSIMITFSRAIRIIMGFSRWVKFFITKFTNHVIYLQRYYNTFINWYQSYNVYDIEVEDSHTYYAGGILVHNCPFCLALHGKPMALGSNYYDIGTVLTGTTSDGKKRTLKLNYEEIKRPPLHTRCRCRIIGKVTI